MKYKVTAVIDGKESEFSSEATVDDCRNMIGMIDDQDERIKYTGSWGNWISQEGNYGGSVKYLEDPTGTETAERVSKYSPVHKTTEVKLKSLSTEKYGQQQILIRQLKKDRQKYSLQKSIKIRRLNTESIRLKFGRWARKMHLQAEIK